MVLLSELVWSNSNHTDLERLQVRSHFANNAMFAGTPRGRCKGPPLQAPPHRSGRAELPHPALTSGVWHRSVKVDLILFPCHAVDSQCCHTSECIKALTKCPGRGSLRLFPSAGRLSSTPSAGGRVPPSFGSFSGTTKPRITASAPGGSDFEPNG